MAPRDHADRVLGHHFVTPDAGEKAKRMEAIYKGEAGDRLRGREMGQGARKECERYPDGAFFLVPSLSPWHGPATLYLHGLCEKPQSQNKSPFMQASLTAFLLLQPNYP